MTKSRSLRSLAVGALIGSLTAALVTTTVIYAHGGDAALLHGCINVNGGLRITGAPGYGNPSTGCAGGEVSVDWSQQGPAGPAGPAGATGPAGGIGPPGPAGPAPTSGDITQALRTNGLPRDLFVDVTATSGARTAARVKTVTAVCPDAFPIAISGGFQAAPSTAADPAASTSVVLDARIKVGRRTGWRSTVSRVRRPLGSVTPRPPAPWTLTVRASCARSS